MLRRSSPFVVLGMIALVASCDSLTSAGSSGTPVGVAVMNARTSGIGYTTSPKVNFYSVGSVTFNNSTITSDTCFIAPYDSTVVESNPSTQLGAGAFLVAAVSGDTDSLYKAPSGDQTYSSRHTSGMPFNPGDSIWFYVPGDAAGFPTFQVRGKTAEPFYITRPIIPPANNTMIVNWQQATDANAAMYVLLLFNLPVNNAAHGTGLNTQIFCDFRDDGQGTVQAVLANQLSSSNIPFVLRAQRVRTNLAASTTTPTAYLNVVSTFDWPTAVSP